MQTIAIKFDSSNPNWTGNNEQDRMFLCIMEQYINDILKHRGYIYLNQIYEHLGIEWNPDDRNTCVRSKVKGKLPFVLISVLYEPDGTLSELVHITLYFV